MKKRKKENSAGSLVSTPADLIIFFDYRSELKPLLNY